jgi:hypothetical protein
MGPIWLLFNQDMCYLNSKVGRIIYNCKRLANKIIAAATHLS